MKKFDSKVDWIPSFWNFLADLNRDDLIAELIQNDLDQDATSTEISFEEDELICYGNGRPVDKGGWRRLSFIQGAGDLVSAKSGKIGVKNHGLKTAFTLGDRLHLMSDGKSIEQTLFADGNNYEPRPGASTEPVIDIQAPVHGCRIVIPYRTTTLRPQKGEKISWQPPTEEEIKKLFQNACSNIPEQFVGIVSPGRVTRYEIVLKHWQLGDVHFHFSCTKGKKINNKRMEIYRRKCEVAGTVELLPDTIHEQAVRRLMPLRGQLNERCPDFYRRGKQFTAEVSWATNNSGKPLTKVGRFRYPIGYPVESQQAYTGHGSSFNVPVVSNSKRHAPAANEETNDQLREVCYELLVDALAFYLIPRWRANGLIPIVPNRQIENTTEIVSSLLSELVNRKKLPVLNWNNAVEASTKSKKHKKSFRQLSRRKLPREEKGYCFVIPRATWEENSISPILSVLCPRSEMQLDPNTPVELVKILVGAIVERNCKNITTFDETDVVHRITSEVNNWFGTIPNLSKELAEPVLAKHYLDLITLALDKDKEFKAEHEDGLLEALLLPDSHSQAQPLDNLYSSNLLLSDIPGLDIPPTLHPDIVKHPLLRRKKWRRRKYTMKTFLESHSLQVANEKIRAQFWQWLRKNSTLISSRDRTKLADLSIWPDHCGQLTTLLNLCAPPSRKVQSILASCIRQPHREIKRSGLVTFGKRGRMTIRSKPTADEVSNWLNSRLIQFELGNAPERDDIQALNHFEDELCILIKDKAILELLRKIETTPIPTLAKDGTIQARSDLIVPNNNVKSLSLPARYLLYSSKANSLIRKIEPTLSQPTVSMLLDSLSENPTNIHSLQSRLRLLLNLNDPNSDALERVSMLEIIPVDGKFRKPSELTFKGNRGDYWGDWKERIIATGLSQDEQFRYLKIGVTSSVPNPNTSREFFKWAANLDEADLERHIPCILRHILHENGPTSWAQSFTDTPFLPVKTKSAVKLASLQDVIKRPVFLSDVEEIGNNIILRDEYVMLVIERVKEIKKPITELCRNLGVHSLRQALKEPECVYSANENLFSPEEFLVGLKKLHVPKFRNTLQKRLVALGVPSDLIHKDWNHRLEQIEDIGVSTELKARYRFRGRVYDLNVDAGFDVQSKVFWIKIGSTPSSNELYMAIAKHRIFKPSALPMHHFMLEHAVNLELSEPSFQQFRKEDSNDDPQNETELEDENEDTTEAVIGHAPFALDLKRNLPDPSPISTISTRNIQENRGSRQKTESSGSINQAPEIEKEHIEILKTEQYASHCQICLSNLAPKELAPEGSYVYGEEVRRSVIHAHHVDPKSGGGARHAGNLILLCKYHHENYGRRLTRRKVTKALRENSNPQTIRFGENLRVEGKLIKYTIPDDVETIEIFFTNHHAEFWLNAIQNLKEGKL